MEIVVKEVADLTDKEFKQCYRLNLGKRGEMRDELLNQYYTPIKSKKTAKAVMLKQEDKMIGWAIVFPLPKTKGYAAHFYVRSSHRRRGYGTMLLNKVAEYDSKPIVYPHDTRSGGLLKKTPVRCHVSERIWLKNEST